MADSPNSTLPWVSPTCSSENWSNGSALSVLFALAVGCLAHPRGSLTFNKSGRIWRLSPHFGLIETLNLCLKLIIALVMGYSLHVICVTLLALRGGNTWTSEHYNAYQMIWAINQTAEQAPIESIGRSATFDAEEGRANGNLHQRASRAAAPEGDDEIEMANQTDQETNGETAQAAGISINAPSAPAFDAELLSRQVHLAFDPKNRQSMMDSMFLTHLDETQKYENGITFRLLVWVPMLLALLKILSVTGGWSIWGPKVCGCMFFCSWLTTELITIVASRRHLSGEERDTATQLGRRWRKKWEEKKMPIHNALIDPRPLHFLSEDSKAFILGRLSCTILLGFNVWPVLAYTASPYFSAYLRYYLWVDSFLWQAEWSYTKQMWMSPIEITVIFVVVVFPFFLYVSAYFGLIYSVATPWALHLSTLLLLLLASSAGIPGRIFSNIFHAMKLSDVDGLVPGYLSFVQAVLTVLRYTRVLNDYASYDCSTTAQVSWYDWTG